MIIAIAVVVTNVSSEPIKQLSVGKIDENILRRVLCLLSRLWLIWCCGGGVGGGELRPHMGFWKAGWCGGWVCTLWIQTALTEALALSPRIGYLTSLPLFSHFGALDNKSTGWVFHDQNAWHKECLRFHAFSQFRNICTDFNGWVSLKI